LIEQFSHWLATTALSRQFQTAGWFVPLVQTVHILAIAAAVTLAGVLDLRLLGFARLAPPSPEVARGVLPWFWRALLALFVTGVLLTITEPARELLSSLFRLKMLLVLILAGVMLFLQMHLQKSHADSQPALVRLLGAISVVLLIAIIVAGRWIAYV